MQKEHLSSGVNRLGALLMAFVLMLTLLPSMSISAAATEMPKLEALSLSKCAYLNPAFNPDTLEYETAAGFNAYSDKEIFVTAQATDDATIAVNDTTVESGEKSDAVPLEKAKTDIKITVTQDGQKTVYTIHVTKMEKKIDSFILSSFIGDNFSNATKAAPEGSPVTLSFAGVQWDVSTVADDTLTLTASGDKTSDVTASTLEANAIQTEAAYDGEAGKTTLVLDNTKLSFLQPAYAQATVPATDEKIEQVESVGAMEWTCGVPDDSNTFSVEELFKSASAGHDYSFTYTNATVGDTICACLVEDDSSPDCYFSPLKVVTEGEEDGSVSFPLSYRTNDGEYTLYIFTESTVKNVTDTVVTSPLSKQHLNVKEAGSDPSLEPFAIPGVEIENPYKGDSASPSKPCYAEVPYMMETIPLTLTVVHDGTTIKVNEVPHKSGTMVNYPLSVGLNTFEIKATAENKTRGLSIPLHIKRLTADAESLSLSLDNSVLKKHSSNGYSSIQMGVYNKKPMTWRILDTTSNDGVTDALFLQGMTCLYPDPTNPYGGNYLYGKEGGDNTWVNSNLKEVFTQLFTNRFSTAEQSAILATTKTESGNVDVPTEDDSAQSFAPSNLNEDKLFPLSVQEVTNPDYGFDSDGTSEDVNRKNPDSWGGYWLRSPKIGTTDYIAQVAMRGNLDAEEIRPNFAMAGATAAMNIDKNAILFTADASNGKTGTVGSFTNVETLANNLDWRLTLKDSARTFAVTEAEVSGMPTNTVTLHYTGAIPGDNEFISALLVKDSTPLAYGRMQAVETADGTVSVSIPKLDAGTYTLKLFNENYQENSASDVASAFNNVTLTVEQVEGTLAVFDSLGGSTVASQVITNSQSKRTLDKPADPTKSGYAFIGWYQDKTFKTPWDFSTKIYDKDVTLYARWEKVDLHAEHAGTYTCDVDLSKLGVENACIVIVEDGNPAHKACAPYVEGKITVRVPSAGDYTFSAGESLEDETQTGKLNHEKIIEHSYIGDGSIGNPYHFLANFMNKKQGGFGMMWYIPTTWAGYETNGAEESSSEYNVDLVKSVVMEARDFETGKLLGSMTMDGSRRERVPIGRKFPFPMSLTINPTEDAVNNWIDNNKLYSFEATVEGYDAAKRTTNLKAAAKTALDSNDEILMVHESRRENFGPYTMKMEVVDQYGFTKGQAVDVVYLGGTGGGDYQGGTEPAPALKDRLDGEHTNWDDYYSEPVKVDKNGYVTFDLYNSGLFKLVKSEKSATVKHTVNFNTLGGSIVKTAFVEDSISLEAPANPTKPGFVFDGWYLEESCENKYMFNRKVFDDMNLFAKWTESASSFEVTFIDATVPAQTINNGGLVQEPTTPTKENNIFVGWFSDVERTQPWDFATDQVFAITTLYAKFLPVAHADLTAGVQTLSVDMSGHDGAWIVELTNGTEVVSAVTENGNITVNVLKDGDYAIAFIGKVSDRTLTGKSEPLDKAYQGDGSSDAPYVILADILQDTSSTMFGLKWATPANWAGYAGGGANNQTSETKEAALLKHVTFETRNPETGVLLVSANLNGAERNRIPLEGKCPFNINFSMNPTDAQIDSWLAGNTLYCYEGTVEGYGDAATRAANMKATASAVSAANTETLMLFDNGRQFYGPVHLVLNATPYGFQTGDTVYITYLGGTGGGEFHYITPPVAERLPLEFTYHTENTTSAVVDENGYLTFTLHNGGAFKLSKTETNTFKASFNTNGGSAIAPITMNEVGEIAKPADPTRSGYAFKGWFSDEALTQSFDFSNAISKDIVLFAKWERDGGGGPVTPTEKTYTVCFMVGKTSSGENAAKIADQKVKAGNRADDPADDKHICPFGFYDRGDGYMVLNWYTDEDLSHRFRFNDSIEENTNLYPEYIRYIFKDDGRHDSGSGSCSHPYRVQLGDTHQSKIAWKLLNLFADGDYDGYYHVYVCEDNDGDELFSWNFNSSDFSQCDIAQPYYVYVDTHKTSKGIELKMANRTAIEGKISLQVNVENYVTDDGTVKVAYQSGTCDGRVAHSNYDSSNWENCHHTPVEYYDGGEAKVEDGIVTLDITHGGTYLLTGDIIKGSSNKPADNGGSTIPVKETEKTEINAQISVKNGVAKTSISTKEVKNILQKESDKTTEIIVDAAKKNAHTVEIDTKIAKTIADSKRAAELTLKTSRGSISLSKDALADISNTAKYGDKLTVGLHEIKATADQKAKPGEFAKPTDKKNAIQQLANEGHKVVRVEAKVGSKTLQTDGKIELTLSDKAVKEMQAPMALVKKSDGTLELTPVSISGSEIRFSATANSEATVIERSEAPVELVFQDVNEKTWCRDSIAFNLKNGIMNGSKPDTFMPQATTNRAMLVAMLYRLEGKPKAKRATFADAQGIWCEDAISWATENGIVNGFSDTTFAPNATLSREQMVAILHRYAQKKGKSVEKQANLNQFHDTASVNDYAKDAMAWAVGNGIITGKTETQLAADNSANRGQVATILMRFETDFMA